MTNNTERGFNPWTIQIISLAVQAAVTYGIMSTQIQWMRADISRLEAQLSKVEARYETKEKP
jgi:hypothetical protein